MRLDPALYLRAFHDELRGILDEGGAVDSPRNAMVLGRIAEGLLRIMLDLDMAPGLMTTLRGEEAAALASLEHRLADLTGGAGTRRLRYIAGQQVSADPIADHIQLLEAHSELLSAIGNAAQHDDTAIALLSDAVRSAVAFEEGVRFPVRAEMRQIEQDRRSGGVAGRKERPLEAATLEAHLHRSDPSLAALRILLLAPLWTNSSKEALLIETDGGAGWPHQAVMRREPFYSIVVSSLADEHDVLTVAYAAGLPVPRPLFAEHDPSPLDGRFIIMARAEGSAGRPASYGDAAVGIFDEMAAFLAGLHAIDPASVERLRADLARPVRDVVRERIEQYHAIWRRDRLGPSAMIEAAFAWLGAHLHLVDDDPVIVHGDYDMRNVLTEQGHVSAVLDWELSRFGHRMEDLAYIRYEVEQSMSWEAFVEAYRRAGGGPVNEEQIRFFVIWSAVWRIVVVVTAASGYGHAHREFVFGSTAYMEYDEHMDWLVRCLRDL